MYLEHQREQNACFWKVWGWLIQVLKAHLKTFHLPCHLSSYIIWVQAGLPSDVGLTLATYNYTTHGVLL